MDKPKHFGSLGARAAVPWVRCPLCAAPMNLRSKKDGDEIYGCSNFGQCSGSRQREDVDTFFEGVMSTHKHAEIVSAVATVDANGGLVAHLTEPDGPEKLFVVRQSRVGLSRTMRSEQSKRLAAEKAELAHIIPGQWNPQEGHLAVLTVSQNWWDGDIPEGAVVVVTKIINDGQHYEVVWLSAPGKTAEAKAIKVQRNMLRGLRPGDTLWSIDENGKTATGRSAVPQYTTLVMGAVEEAAPDTFTVTDDRGKELPLKHANVRLIALANSDVHEGSFFKAEGVARVLRVRQIVIEDVVYVVGDNAAKYRLNDITLLTDEEVEEDVGVLPKPADEPADAVDALEFDFGF